MDYSRLSVRPSMQQKRVRPGHWHTRTPDGALIVRRPLPKSSPVSFPSDSRATSSVEGVDRIPERANEKNRSSVNDLPCRCFGGDCRGARLFGQCNNNAIIGRGKFHSPHNPVPNRHVAVHGAATMLRPLFR
ncbi:bcl-2-like protein 13 isoform d [Anopheles sinensis]|uniref:Bcl-2-like protein 13 isoform d n=1 Tax=Anopheles sinensis TaxID=74873 RepID=A0A084VTC1_ANOSI|nr:bcl-2-like protein 13 isoform d [Anopheles sinensis]